MENEQKEYILSHNSLVILKEAIEKAEKYDEVEQENKVLKNGIKTLLNKFSVSKNEINSEFYIL